MTGRRIFVLFLAQALLLIALAPCLAFASEPKESQASSSESSEETEVRREPVDFDEDGFYQFYQVFLKDNVSDFGQLSYAAIKARPDELDKFLHLLEIFPKDVFDSMNQNEKIAFWINSYNALMIKVVVSHFPIKKPGIEKVNRNFPRNSVRQIPGAWSGIKHNIMGRLLTLQQIEQDILRKEFNEPRVNLALVKASKSSPILRNKPYLGSKLDEQLREQTKNFLRDPGKFVLEKDSRKVRLSPMFDWYASDFARAKKPQGRFNRYPRDYGAVLQFISEHLSESDAEYLKKRTVKLSYLEYDWRLNDINVPTVYEPEEDVEEYY